MGKYEALRRARATQTAADLRKRRAEKAEHRRRQQQSVHEHEQSMSDAEAVWARVQARGTDDTAARERVGECRRVLRVAKLSVEVLDAEIAELDAEIAAAQQREAVVQFENALIEAHGAHATLDNWLREQAPVLLPVLATVFNASEVADEWEARAGGHRIRGDSKVMKQEWQQRPRGYYECAKHLFDYLTALVNSAPSIAEQLAATQGRSKSKVASL